jgi:hypothetical protein
MRKMAPPSRSVCSYRRWLGSEIQDAWRDEDEQFADRVIFGAPHRRSLGRGLFRVVHGGSFPDDSEREIFELL